MAADRARRHPPANRGASAPGGGERRRRRGFGRDRVEAHAWRTEPTRFRPRRPGRPHGRGPSAEAVSPRRRRARRPRTVVRRGPMRFWRRRSHRPAAQGPASGRAVASRRKAPRGRRRRRGSARHGCRRRSSPWGDRRACRPSCLRRPVHERRARATDWAACRAAGRDRPWRHREGDPAGPQERRRGPECNPICKRRGVSGSGRGRGRTLQHPHWAARLRPAARTPRGETLRASGPASGTRLRRRTERRARCRRML